MENYEGPAEMYVQGRLLAEAQEVSVTFKANNNKVLTMKRGLAGKSDGPRETEITIKSAVPRKGFEVNFVDHLLKGKILSVVYRSGGKRFTIDAWCDESQHTNSTDSSAVNNITMSGGPPKVQG